MQHCSLNRNNLRLTAAFKPLFVAFVTIRRNEIEAGKTAVIENLHSNNLIEINVITRTVPILDITPTYLASSPADFLRRN